MSEVLTLRTVRNIAFANYHRGGDYIVEYLSDDDIRNFIAQGGTKSALYSLMDRYQEIRAYFRNGGKECH